MRNSANVYFSKRANCWYHFWIQIYKQMNNSFLFQPSFSASIHNLKKCELWEGSSFGADAFQWMYLYFSIRSWKQFEMFLEVCYSSLSNYNVDEVQTYLDLIVQNCDYNFSHNTAAWCKMPSAVDLSGTKCRQLNTQSF